jgi:hypothetical protein
MTKPNFSPDAARAALLELPNHGLKQTAQLWISTGQITSGFFAALMANDLQSAASHADEYNRACLADWADWVARWRFGGARHRHSHE